MYLSLPKVVFLLTSFNRPISHAESMAHATTTMIEETNKYKSALKAFYNSHNENLYPSNAASPQKVHNTIPILKSYCSK